MNIYESEIKDGLAEIIMQRNSVACCALAESYEPSQEAIQDLNKIVAKKNDGLDIALAENESQIDLYYLKSILVSSGWNKNDDVFDPQELWDARNTPEDKPFNYMHDEKDIIGHITSNAAVDFDGNEISDIQKDGFNILTSAVIYTEWSDPEQRSRMQKIVSEIEEGKWFVSMECLFPNFDYALRKDNGETSVLQRNEASAFLTKHLRSYGGNGKYENYRVGRLLRNLSFSGKGLVSKPANPRSVILDGNEFFDETKSQILTVSSIKEKDMSDVDKQIDDLRAELAEAKAANEVLKDKVVAEQQAEFESKIQALEATIAEQAEALEAKDATINEQAEAIKHGEEDMKKKMEELRKMKKKEAKMKREAQLQDLGLDAEEAEATLAEFEDADDATFEKVVAAMTKVKMMEKKKADMHGDKKKEEEKAMKMKEEALKEKEAKAEEELDSAEASEELLEDVEESAEVAIAEAVGEEDPSQSLRAVASEWLGSVLQHTPKN